MTTHAIRSALPNVPAIAGSAAATMVWSAPARNIGSAIDGKTAKNRLPEDGVTEGEVDR